MMLVEFGDRGGGGVGMVGVLVRVGVCIRSIILMGVGASCCCVAGALSCCTTGARSYCAAGAHLILQITPTYAKFVIDSL